MARAFEESADMVKSINNRRGKSDHHQAHELLYSAADHQSTLERWFTNITTPKEKKTKKYGDPRSKCRGGPGRDEQTHKKCLIRPKRPVADPDKLAARKEKNKQYWARIWEMKRMAAEDINVRT